jgi:hypothetical protein
MLMGFWGWGYGVAVGGRYCGREKGRLGKEEEVG